MYLSQRISPAYAVAVLVIARLPSPPIACISNRGEDPMAKFDQETLRKLHDRKEVAIRTAKHPGSAVTIWVVASGTDVLGKFCAWRQRALV